MAIYTAVLFTIQYDMTKFVSSVGSAIKFAAIQVNDNFLLNSSSHTLTNLSNKPIFTRATLR